MTKIQKQRGAWSFRTFSMSQLESASHHDRGYCIGCGTLAESIEPDARGYACTGCKQPQVYGAEELMLMGRAR
jgi:hypothetical protein